MTNQKSSVRKLIYDYIVVGSGPAGAVIAKALTDDKKNSLLLLEAGENHDRDKPISDSAFAPELEERFFPKYFWQGEGIPQKDVSDRSFEWTTGRLSGGGSSINGEQYVRPSSAVLREWQRLLGPLWSPRLVLNRFKKIEKYNGLTSNRNAHGFSGRINIRQAPKTPTRMAQKLVLAIEQATGFKRILDYNNPATPLGPFTRWQLYQKPNGRRESSSTAFLANDVVSPSGFGVNGRKLRVLYKSTALRVLFSNNRAVGVEILKNGQRLNAIARKKVIISAGINSTQLLMLSGIGPAQHLRKAGVSVVFNNPNVGKNLTNHTLNFAVFTANKQDNTELRTDRNALYAGGAFLPGPTPGANRKRRGVQLIGIAAEGTLTLAIIFLQPKSKGEIQLQSNDPLEIVLGDEGFLTNRADLQAVKNIYKTYIKNIAAKLSSIDPAYKLTSPSLDTINNDVKLEKFIKENFGHNHHQQGALRMAPLHKGGVVDRHGNVHGVRDLIVADASIVPFTVDGNTSAAAFLIGSTIAEHLLKKRTT